MRKLKAFNYIFRKSITSFSYYHEVVKTKFSFSLKYFIFFSFLFGTMLSISLSFVIIPSVNTVLNRFQSRIASLYPIDLVITVRNGEVSTNTTEPLRFPIPIELFTEVPGAISDQNQKYLLTIDTKAKIEDYAQNQSIILVTRDSAVISENNSYRVYPLKDVGDVTVNKQLIDDLLVKLTPILKYLPILTAVLLWFILTIFLPLSRLLSLLILSLILLLAGNLMKLNLSYKKIYQIGLHSLTLPTLIQIGLLSFGLIPPIPFFNSILFILYTLIIFAELKKPPALIEKKSQ